MGPYKLSKFSEIQQTLIRDPKVWLVTGVAGFIGSNLLQTLLCLNQRVVGLDNLETGHQRNLSQVRDLVTSEQWTNFTFIEGDICNFEDCLKSMHLRIYKDRKISGAASNYEVAQVDYVLHQAALGSVPRSLKDPLKSNLSNITGFLNILEAARRSGVKGFVYAASSSTYGDHPKLPKVEDIIGRPLSPYAVTKYVNELYANVYASCYGFKSIGLRYFNVFGPRQDPDGAYAAVIPKWLDTLINNEVVTINGDGETSRDFCFVDNAVQANILAACAEESSKDQVYNIAFGDRTSLLQLQTLLRRALSERGIDSLSEISFSDFRHGDVRHSQADISKAITALGYEPSHDVKDGINELVEWKLRRISMTKK